MGDRPPTTSGPPLTTTTSSTTGGTGTGTDTADGGTVDGGTDDVADDGPTNTGGDDTPTGDDEGGSDGPTDTGDGDDEGDGGDGTRFDLGVTPDGPSDPPPDDGCTKVDFLFVIDHSGSMRDEQVNLVSAFPGFITSIQDTLKEANDYHIGVVATEDYENNGDNCTQMGSLVTATTGAEQSSNMVCSPYAGGARFMTQEEADLNGKFACAAQIGIDGDGDEKPFDAARAALSAPMNGGGGCNEGFLRDDALLVLVIITDEEDDLEPAGPLSGVGSAGNPPDWYADIIARKADIESNMVVLSIIGHNEPAGTNVVESTCAEFDGINGAEDAPRIVQFTQMFTHWFIGDVCAAGYDEIFMRAISVIEDACNDFDPPG